MRVWLPDRPGALGAVASRIGAVRGDLVGIDILERGAGRAIDELVVELPEPELVPLMVGEITEVDGVDVEDVRPASDHGDLRLEALETATALVAEATVGALLAALAQRSREDFSADWCVVFDLEAGSPVTSIGPAPPDAWLDAFVAGCRVSAVPSAAGQGPDDVAWADLPAASLVVLLGRRGRPLRVRERRQLGALARIVDLRWSELVTCSARTLHPSAPAS